MGSVIGVTQHLCTWLKTELLKAGAIGAFGLAACDAAAQYPAALPPVVAPPPASVGTPSSLPQPIYWKQHLFLIPYQWGSAAQAGAAQAVTLYVSKDRGASWQKLSDAKPQVKAFNYRAEGDGEYWFAVRTLDARGRSWPEGPFQPELRVIVDTTIPRIDQLQASPSESGAIDIECRATDVNLDGASLRIETLGDAQSAWQRAALQPLGGGEFGLIRVRCQPIGGVRPVAVRATIFDRAGNSTVYQTPVGAAPGITGPQLAQPTLNISAMSGNPFDARPALPGVSPGAPPAATMQDQSGVASTSSGSASQVNVGVTSQAATQPWPAGAMANAPFRLWTSGAVPQDDGLTAYGTPPITTSGSQSGPAMNSKDRFAANSDVNNDSRVPAQYAGATRSTETSSASGWTSAPASPHFAPVEPYRQSAQRQSPDVIDALVPVGQAIASANNANITPADGASLPPAEQQLKVHPKLVGSRTFALEYELDGAGGAGVASVELWGTRDGGKNWNRYAQDDDNRSPLVVTVDDEGLYGFKIVVQGVGGAGANVPRGGEEPELWVSVDLKRPMIELTSIERGEGNLSDHLILHWRAEDNNLEDRPIALYFSSRASGPWSAIATNLENTGHYAWRVERYVPSRIFLRIEARDVAGNLAAFQTREPVEFAADTLSARLRGTTTRANGPTIQTPIAAGSPGGVGR